VTSVASTAGMASRTIIVAPAFLQGQRIVLQALGRSLALALHLVTAQGVHGLRGQAEVAADRNAALDEEFDGFAISCRLPA
jgi:hypothetical protein